MYQISLAERAERPLAGLCVTGPDFQASCAPGSHGSTAQSTSPETEKGHQLSRFSELGSLDQTQPSRNTWNSGAMTTGI